MADAAAALDVSGSARARLSPRVLALAALEAEQDRWFLWVPVAFGLGVLGYFALSAEPSWLPSLTPLAAALVLSVVWQRGVLAVLATGAAIALTLGFSAAKLRTAWVAAPVLERQMGPVEVRGFVELVEPRPNRGERLTLLVTSIRGLSPERTPLRVRIRAGAALPGLMPGQAVRVRATLAPPAIPVLPGDYDFARMAFFLGLGGVGYSLGKPELDASAPGPPLRLELLAAISRARQAISRRIRAALPGERGAIADALITGERGGISEATNTAFRASGLFHILSISGLHMTIMAGAVFFAVRLGLAAVPALALRYPIKKWAAVAAAVAALGYLLISGSSPATVRSWVMISIMFLAVLLDRPALAMRNVALSALLILLLFPETLFDVGFQMSYAAVVALVAGYEAIRDRRAEREEGGIGPLRGTLLFFGGIVLSTLIASVSVAPFAVYHFHTSQQYAVIANLIAIPICNAVVMPAALATLVLMPLGLEAGPLWMMGQGIDAMIWCAHAVAHLPGAVARVPAISPLSFSLMVAGGLWVCLWRTRWRLLGLVAVAAGLGLAPALERPDILAGRNGQLVALREHGALTAIASPGTQFELRRWLEHDGDRRTPREAAAAGGYRCDAVGCAGTAKGLNVAVARHPEALVDDCARGGVLILAFPKPRGCMSPGVVIDFFDLRAKGTHALYVRNGEVSVVTVAETRGVRPWTAPFAAAARAEAQAAAGAGRSRLAGFAAPFELIDQPGRRRPEVEDEEPDDYDDGR